MVSKIYQENSELLNGVPIFFTPIIYYDKRHSEQEISAAFIRAQALSFKENAISQYVLCVVFIILHTKYKLD